MGVLWAVSLPWRSGCPWILGAELFLKERQREVCVCLAVEVKYQQRSFSRIDDYPVQRIPISAATHRWQRINPHLPPSQLIPSRPVSSHPSACLLLSLGLFFPSVFGFLGEKELMNIQMRWPFEIIQRHISGNVEILIKPLKNWRMCKSQIFAHRMNFSH